MSGQNRPDIKRFPVFTVMQLPWCVNVALQAALFFSIRAVLQNVVKEE